MSPTGSKIIQRKKHQRKIGTWFHEEKERESINYSYINCLKRAQKYVDVLSRFLLIITLIFPITQCFKRWSEEGTYIDTRLVPQRDALFPATTICPVTTPSGYKHEVLQVLML